MLLYKLFSREFSLVDVVDVALTALLLYQLYKLVRGNLGANIFFGMVLIYLTWLSTRFLGLELLSGILGQFVNAGVIALLIVFQPEIRGFLLQIGKVGTSERKNFLEIFSNKKARNQEQENIIVEISNALSKFSKTKTGALIVFFATFKLHDLKNAGVKINGEISSKLLESIFDKGSPLHDGAVIISRGKIVFAGSVLPVSENQDLPERTGTRHRAALGITEHSDGTVLLVSEETGNISFAKDGKMKTNISLEEVKSIIREATS